MISRLALAAAIAVFLTGTAQAAVSADEAKKLGTTLTPTGAEMAGNKDGTIPAYTGGLPPSTPGFDKATGRRADPFATEKPVLTITGKNMDAYADKLSDGSKTLLKKYPDYRIDVYPTHRTVAVPKEVAENTAKNAVRAKTAEGGLVLTGAYGGYAFPIPANGFEAMWNHLTRYEGFNYHTKYDAYNIDSSGHAVLATSGEVWQQYPYYNPAKTFETNDSDLFYQIKLNYFAPPRRAGEAQLIWDSINPVEKSRRAWQYLPGQRRVKLAPDLSYDTPNPGSAGSTTYDDAFVFNGAMDRFDFKLIGKKEMYIPYNEYRFVYDAKADQVLAPNFLNPDVSRWELHRVWVVEATLKPGTRHIYARRVFYLDEDSWVAVMSDEYDAKNQLFRSGCNHLVMNYEHGSVFSDTQTFNDFISGGWAIQGWVGQHFIEYNDPLPDRDWTADSMAAAGIR